MKKKKISPQTQLQKLLQSREQVLILQETLEVLNNQSQEAFCIAAIAYIKFGIRRPFTNCVLGVLFTSFCDLLDR